MDRFKRLTGFIGAFVFAVAVIVVYKTFDNFGVIGSFLSKFFQILSPFTIGFLIAFLLYVPCKKLELAFLRSRKQIVVSHARGFSVFIVYFILLCSFGLLLAFALPALFSSLADFIYHFPNYVASAETYLSDLVSNNALLAKLNVSGLLKEIDLKKLFSSFNFNSLPSFFNKFMGVTSGIVNFFLSLVVSIYMLLSKEPLLKVVKKLMGLFISQKQLDTLCGYAQKSSKIFYSFFYSQIIDAIIVSIILTIGFLIIGVPYAPLLGVLVGLFNLVPYFGAMIGGVLAVLATLLTDRFYVAVIVAVYIIIMQQIDANLIQPRIVSNSLGLRPIYVLLAITVFGGFFGFWGIFLGVPIMGIIRMLVLDYIEYRDKKRLKNSDPPAPDVQ